jgi:hypothetical protein
MGVSLGELALDVVLIEETPELYLCMRAAGFRVKVPSHLRCRAIQVTPHADGFGFAELVQPAILKHRQDDQKRGSGSGHQQ